MHFALYYYYISLNNLHYGQYRRSPPHALPSLETINRALHLPQTTIEDHPAEGGGGKGLSGLPSGYRESATQPHSLFAVAPRKKYKKKW